MHGSDILAHLDNYVICSTLVAISWGTVADWQDSSVMYRVHKGFKPHPRQ